MPIRRLVFVAAALLAAGCNNEVNLQLATSGTMDTDGTTSVRLAIRTITLTDDAGNVVTIDSDDDGTKEMFDYDGGPTLTLVDGVNVAQGRYVKLGLTFDPDRAEITYGGTDYVIDVSGASTTTDVDFQLVRNEDVSLWLNLDLRLSLGDETATTSRWKLVPRMHAVNLEETASLTGAVAEPVMSSCSDADGAAVYAYPQANLTPYDEEPNASPHVAATAAVRLNADGSGSYAFPHLRPGEYTIALTCVGFADDPLVDQSSSQVPFVDSGSVGLSDGEAGTLDF